MATLTPRADNAEAFKNIVINGNFDLWQRGNTAGLSVNNNTFFFADRWRIQNTAVSNVQVDRSTDVPTVAQSGFASQYSMRLLNSASPSSPTTAFVNIRYVVEGLDYQPLHGRPFRVQFWVKSSIVGTYSVKLGNSDGSRTIIKDVTINVANTWERKIVDVTGDTSGTWLFDSSAGLRFYLNLQTPVANRSNSYSDWATDTNTFFSSTAQVGWNVTASSTFFLAQVSIIPGSFDTTAEVPFQRAGKTIANEVALCQRYYEKSYTLDTVPGTIVSGGTFLFSLTDASNPSAGQVGSIKFSVFKRATPTVVLRSQDTGGVDTITISTVASGAPAAYSGINQGGFIAQWSGQAIGTVKREFYGHWTADAEL